MKRTNKKGFTIVELVIVIAVIAILAAVLIPTISNVVKKAEESAYLQDRTNKQTEGVIEKIDNPNYMTWEDFEGKLKSIFDKVGNAPTDDTIKEAISEALADYNDTNLNEDIVKKIVEKELEEADKSLTEEDIQKIADAVIEQIDSNASAEDNSTVSTEPAISAEESSEISEESSANSSADESSDEESSEISEELSEEPSEEALEELLPIAYVETLDPNDERFVGIPVFGASFTSPFMPDVAYAFYSYPPEIRGDDKIDEREEFKNKFTKYLKWHADYEIESDKNVASYSIYLAGSYAAFGGMGILSDTEVPANTPIRLLNIAFPDGEISYNDLFDLVTEFDCGIANLIDDNIGTVIKVRLCLYPVEDGVETGEKMVVCEYEYVCKTPSEINAAGYASMFGGN